METPVLIVGGGPAGLACSLLLTENQIPHILVEKHPGTSTHPKAMGLMTRTMEIFRSFDAAREMSERALPEDWLGHTYWLSSLTGPVFREFPLVDETTIDSAAFSPEKHLHCPQTITEEILLKQARLSPLADIRFRHELASLTQDDSGVTVSVTNLESGETSGIKARYVIAADGSSSSVREMLGIKRQGPSDMGHFANIYFRADIGDRLSQRKGIIYNCLSEKDFGSVVAINGKDEWLLHRFLLPGETIEQFTFAHCRTLVSAITGIAESEITILGMSPWVMSAQISSSFRKGRVFLTGDAAHRTTPVGGLGLNTGIHSAHNLCWKLASVIKDWCDESLLETYEEERRAIAMANIEMSRGRAGGFFPIIEAALSGKWEEAMEGIQALPPAHGSLEPDLGYRYSLGAFAFAGKDPAPDAGRFRPRPWIGARAPHAWIDEKTSTLDLFGETFVLLYASPAAEAISSIFVSQAPAGSMWAQAIPEKILTETYECSPDGLVLVRPDGFIAWISKGEPSLETGPIVLQALMLKMALPGSD